MQQRMEVKAKRVPVLTVVERTELAVLTMQRVVMVFLSAPSFRCFWVSCFSGEKVMR